MTKLRRTLKDYRLLFHNCGEPLERQPWPPTAKGLKETILKDLRGHPIDVMSYDVNAACGAWHCSKVFGRMGEGATMFHESGTYKMVEGIRRMEAAGLDPLAVIIEGCHEEGMDINLRVRMNDLHDANYGMYPQPPRPPAFLGEPAFYYMSQFKKDHPEYCLGDPFQASSGAQRFRNVALNFALAPVRRRIFNFIEETVNNYDSDMVTLDFLRFPIFFLESEAYGQRHLMTDFVASIRQCVRQAGERRKRAIPLAVRIPDTVEAAVRAGIDTPEWIRRGLADAVIISGGYCPFDTPWAEVAGLARAAGIPAFACLSHGQLNKVPRGYAHDREELLSRKIRAAAYRAEAAGVQGFELFNFFYMCEYYRNDPVGQGAGYGRGLAFTHELSDAERLRASSKTYEVSQALPSDVCFAHANAAWPGQLPCTIGLSEDGLAHSFTFDVADDLNGPRGQASLWLQFVDLWVEDELEILFNGKPLSFTFDGYWKTQTNLGDLTVALSIRDVRKGENRLALQLKSRPSGLPPYLTLNWALLHVDQPWNSR